MKVARSAPLLLFLLWTASLADATPLSITREDQREVMVTIYNGNLGLVKDLREVRLPASTTEVWFMDVAAQIDPTTVHLRSVTAPAGLKILEQNYEYDLLSSDKLLEKYVGKTVRMYQSDGTYHDARLLTTRGPVFEINGQIYLGHYGRMVLPSLPENLVANPTLALAGTPCSRAIARNSTVKSRQQPTRRSAGARSAVSGRPDSSKMRASISSAYRVSISLIRPGAMPFAA